MNAGADLRGYRAYDDGATEELGRVPVARIGELLAQAQAAAGERGYGIGLYRDEHDFLEARALGDGGFAFRSEHLPRDSAWSRLSAGRRLEFVVANLEQAVAAFVCYAGMPRDAFERKAADFPQAR